MFPAAVIFDMDGTLIDSEPFWTEAEAFVFGNLGVNVAPPDTMITARMTTIEVTRYWFEKYPWSGPGLDEVEHLVISRVSQSIADHGKAMPGAVEVISLFKRMGVKVGIATNSPTILIHEVIKKLDIAGLVDVHCSAEYEQYGKPHPAVYKRALEKLDENPQNCLAFEDSWSGLRSAKAAGIRTVAIPHPADFQEDKWRLADLKVKKLTDFMKKMPNLLSSI